RHTLGRRIFEMERLSGMDEWVDGMRRHRRLGEAREDELQLALVSGDIADGEDAGHRGSAGRGIDDDVVALEVEAPLRDRPEIHGKPEEGEEGIGGEPLDPAIESGDNDLLQDPGIALEPR